MDVVQVQKIHTDPTVIYSSSNLSNLSNIWGKLYHVTYITAATQFFIFYLDDLHCVFMHNCTYNFFSKFPLTSSQDRD